MTHALVTGPIDGRIPHGDGFLNVTPDVIVFDTEEEARAAAEAIELEHVARGTHPVQVALANLDNPELYPDGAPAEVRKEIHTALKALNEKAGI